jgi:hypothetical protein
LAALGKAWQVCILLCLLSRCFDQKIHFAIHVTIARHGIGGYAFDID